MPQGDKHIQRFVAGFNLKTDFDYLNLDAVSAGKLTCRGMQLFWLFQNYLQIVLPSFPSKNIVLPSYVYNRMVKLTDAYVA
jgi:hypothetical protein